MKHIMIDIETLGIELGSPIVSIGAVAFSLNGIEDTFYKVVELDDGWIYAEKETLKWWMKQSDSAREVFNCKGENIDIVLDKLYEFCQKHGEKESCYWAKDPEFDFKFITHEGGADFKELLLKRSRSVRTITDTIMPILGISLKRNDHSEHNALADAKYQAEQVIYCLNKIKELKG